MAAKNCPECNGLVGHGVRKCPHCGFNICKAELEKYERELLQGREERAAMIFEMLKPKMNEEIEQANKQREERAEEYSEKPSFLKIMFIEDGCEFTYIILGVLIISTAIAAYRYSVLAFLIAIAALIATIMLLFDMDSTYKTNMKLYEKYQNSDPEKDKQEEIDSIIEKYKYEASFQAGRLESKLIDEYEEEHFDEEDDDDHNYSTGYDPKFSSSKDEYVPKCPICGSTDLTQISTVKKAAKVATFGIYGAGDIGKTWQCNNCKSKF